MKEGHIRFIIIREDFNEYGIENDLFLRLKPIVSDMFTKGNENTVRLTFEIVSRVIMPVSSNEVKYDQTKKLQFKPLREVINIYETDTAIILVGYQLKEVLPTNERNNEGVPILSVSGDTLVNVVEKPPRSTTDSLS